MKKKFNKFNEKDYWAYVYAHQGLLRNVEKFKSTSISRRVCESYKSSQWFKENPKQWRRNLKRSRIYQRNFNQGNDAPRWDLLVPGNYICGCDLVHRKIERVELKYCISSKHKPDNASVYSDNGQRVCDWRNCGTFVVMRESELENCPSCKWFNENEN